MSTTGWIIVAIIVVAVVALGAWLLTQQRRKQQHERAERLRQEAHEEVTELPDAQRRADAAAAEAERARIEAEQAQEQAREAEVAVSQQEAAHEDRLRTADEVDPSVDTAADDYQPGSTADPAAAPEGTRHRGEPDTTRPTT